MRSAMVMKGGATLATALVLAFALATAVGAQGGQVIRVPMSVTENRESGLMGSATITPLGNRMWRVEISMTGLPPNDTPRPAHIHTGSGAQCDTGDPITYPLTNVAVDAAGRGTSVTTITITNDKLVTGGNAYLNVHNPAQGGRGVFCGNITQSLGATGPGTGAGGGPAGAAQPAAQRPSSAPAVAQPAAQRPAAAPAVAAAAPRPASAPVSGAVPAVGQPAAQRPAALAQALPRTGTGGLAADSAGPWNVAGLAAIALLLAGMSSIAIARRRISRG